MVVTQATKQKSPGLPQRGCKCSKAQGAPLRHRGSSARKSHPQGRVEQPSQSPGPGVPCRGAGETGVGRATPTRLLLGSATGRRRGSSLEGILVEAEKPGGTSHNTTENYIDICQTARKKSMLICDTTSSKVTSCE